MIANEKNAIKYYKIVETLSSILTVFLYFISSTMEKIKLLLLHEVSWDIVECTCCERKMKVGISRHTRLQDVFRVYDEEIKNILRQFEQYIEDEIERETIQLYDARYKRLSEEKELNLYWSPLENDDVPEDEKKNPIMSTTPKDQKKRAMSTSPEDGKKYAMSVCPEDQQLDDIDMQ